MFSALGVPNPARGFLFNLDAVGAHGADVVSGLAQPLGRS